MNGSIFVKLIIWLLLALIMIYSKAIITLTKKRYGSINFKRYLLIVIPSVCALILGLLASISLTGTDFKITNLNFLSYPFNLRIPLLGIGFIVIIVITIIIAYKFSKDRK